MFRVEISHARLVPALVALLALAVAAAGCQRLKPGQPRRVVVLDFASQVEDAGSAPRAQAVADLMTASLANYPRVAVVERQGLRPLMDQALNKTLTIPEFGRLAEVDYVVVGSLAKLNENLVLSARLLSVKSGQLVPGSSVTRACKREEDLYPLVQNVSRIMAHHLQVLAERYDAMARGENSAASDGAMMPSQPSAPQQTPLMAPPAQSTPPAAPPTGAPQSLNRNAPGMPVVTAPAQPVAALGG